MSLRSRLLVAFFLLSVVPISAIAAYSYLSSQAALRDAARHEADLLARELELRMTTVADRLSRRVRELGEVPVEVWVDERTAARDADFARLSRHIGETLPFLEGLEFVPAPDAVEMEAATAEVDREMAAAEVAAVAALHPEEAAGAPAPPRPPGAHGLPLPPEAPQAPAVAAAPPRPPLPAIVLPADLPQAEAEIVRHQLERVREQIARSIAVSIRHSAESKRTRGEAAGAIGIVTEVAQLAQLGQQLAADAERQARLAERAVADAHPEWQAAKKTIGDELSCPLTNRGQVVGTLRGRIKAKTLLGSVLAETHREAGEIPFALDADANLYTARAADRERLGELPAGVLTAGAGSGTMKNWVVVSRLDAASGVRFGIARPLTEALAELRRALARNLTIALGLFGVCLAGIFPLSKRLSRGLEALSAGAERLAAGDLAARVPVASNDELGRLAGTFNRMAEELRAQQERLVAEERRRRDEEIGHRLLVAENERRGRELEEARDFQLSLLPRELPALPGIESAVAMQTATEVGGDYYDALTTASGAVVLALGDATGHGAASATMVTVGKSLFMADAAGLAPAAFLGRATELVHRMQLGRMAMAMTVLRLEGRRARLSSAAMPPTLWFHAASGEVEEIALPGTPLGALAGATYREVEIELAAGDALLLMSDGFPELRNAAGEPLGYEAARACFAACAGERPAEVLAALDRAALAHTGGAPLADDVTFLLLRATA